MSFLKTMINSVARTFGRILAYFLIGLAIYFIASKVNAQPQYRMSNLSGEWGDWNNISPGDTYSSSTNITTSWGSYIQLKDTTTMENNKSYNLNSSFQIKIVGQGDRELFSSIVPYIYNGSTLSESDKCTISGTKSDSTSSGLLPSTTHIYNANINCVGLKNTGYYPYITIRFKANQNTLLTSMQLNVSSWNFTIGSDSTDANNIMNNANQNTQNIINGLNDMGDSITNSVNQSTSEVIEALENQNKVCSNYNFILNNSTINNDISGSLNSTGGISLNNDYYVTSQYYKITNGKSIYIDRNWTNNVRYCIYDNNSNMIECPQYGSNNNITVTPQQDGYIRFTYRYSGSYQMIITGEYCYDYREKETEQNEEINNNLHNMLTLFSSDSTPSQNDINSILSDIEFSDDTPVSNFIMFPIVIFSFFSESMSNTCSPISLGELYGHELQLPCLNLPVLFGATIWNMIDLLFCFFMIYNIVHFFISIFEDVSELRSPFLKIFIKNRGVIEK